MKAEFKRTFRTTVFGTFILVANLQFADDENFVAPLVFQSAFSESSSHGGGNGRELSKFTALLIPAEQRILSGYGPQLVSSFAGGDLDKPIHVAPRSPTPDASAGSAAENPIVAVINGPSDSLLEDDASVAIADVATEPNIGADGISTASDSGWLETYPWTEPHKEFPKVLTLGVVPQQTPADIERRWGPLKDHLEEELSIKLFIKTATSIPTFEDRCMEGRYDLAYMNPYHYVVFSEKAGYRALALQKDKKIKGIMVVRRDRKDHSLESLNGSTLAFPSPAAFAASLLTRAHLESINVDFKPTYVRSHDSVYKAVADGLYPAGGGVMRTFASTEPEVRDQLEIAWTTKPFTPHALAAHQRVPAELIKRIQRSLIELGNREQNPEILNPINFNGFSAATHGDWSDVDDLGLTELDSEPDMKIDVGN